MKTLAEWQKEIHELARSKGWYDTERTALEAHMLVVSEIAEATEAVRAGKPPVYSEGMLTIQRDEEGTPFYIPCQEKLAKPEGEAVELADCVIRIMDYFESKGWDLDATIHLKHEYNKTRAYRHGGKKA